MQHRELLEKGLDQITKDVGEQVRLQSMELKRKIKQNLQREIEAARNRHRSLRSFKR